MNASRQGAVALRRCESYDARQVHSALEAAIASLEGEAEARIQPGMRVYVKPNLVIAAASERAVTTHPAVVEAVVRWVQGRGATVLLGDCPGGPSNRAFVRAIYEKCGMARVAAETGCTLNEDFAEAVYACPDGASARQLQLLKPAMEADAMISVGKLKTHGLTRFTGVCKNLYGLVPGTTKVGYHHRFPDLREFSNLLVDIVECAKPTLSVLDGIVGMEGEGPSAGRPRALNALVVGVDPHAVDYVGAQLIGLDASVCTLARARERGLLDPERVYILGDSVAMLRQEFEIPPPHTSVVGSQNPFLRLFFRTKPVLRSQDACVGCGVCQRSCPNNAIEMHNLKPSFSYKECIRCYCCHELCPQSALQIQKSLLMRLLK